MGETCEVCGRISVKTTLGSGIPGTPIDKVCFRVKAGADTTCFEVGYERSQEALAAARRSLSDMDRLFLGTLAGMLTAIPGDPEQIDDWLRGRVAHAKYQYDELQKARKALADPAAGEEGKR